MSCIFHLIGFIRLNMKKILDRLLNKLYDRLGKYLGKSEITIEFVNNDPYNIVFLNTANDVHVMLVQGDFAEAIPEDGSFKGAYVVSFPSYEQACERLDQLQLGSKGFSRIE